MNTEHEAAPRQGSGPPPELGPGPGLTAMMARWRDGWIAARGYPGAHGPDGVLAVEVGEPGRAVEHVAVSTTPAEHVLLARRIGAGQWLTVPAADRAGTKQALRDAGLHVRAPERLMTVDLGDHPRRTPPAGYDVVSSTTAGGVLVVEVVTDGEVAAKGHLCVVGADAVADRIFTRPDHRRRGLGSVVMGALSARGLEAGARTGILVASADGYALYGSLGWRVAADVVIAERPEPAGQEARAGDRPSEAIE
ncbi:acetyltransferase (GNAT) family protein [Haloactinopolyspora alba]|uniref:Acetyltransferase (GNAT) family protein n=1 Tax=Haloactinopolyspora alba TaxID=648780 RepID=A0A2P8DY82_9ACTN|nr:GNAT family N-acetyltransferase [Haloactinopolyspora alba]PSL02171.1 acetyltransferase (GNAT) family protein [Haloactinopolyspora alba]